MKIRFLRRITPFSACFLFTLTSSSFPAQAAPNKAEIDNYARANGFPQSDHPYYENVNGCGGEGWSETAVRDSWGKVSFREACNNHDRCYMRLGSDVNACDDNFYKDLRASCERDSYIRDPIFNKKIPDPATLSACYPIATTYYSSVRAVGWKWHQGAQAKARRYNDVVQNFLNQASPVTSAYSRFRLQIGTALHETGNNFAFSILPNGDLVAIKKSGTGSGKTEVHILSASSNYQSFRLQTGTALHETGDNFAFSVLPNGDLVTIKKSGTGSGKTEVHILSASSNYQSFRLQTGTALHETGDNFAFGVLPNGDLVAIKKFGTGSGKTDVHILSASSNYQSFRLQTGTALHETGDNFAFGVLPNGDLVA
ncbi:MAG: hypothetical protein GC158_13790, partial [Cyanobacteria bacterium RI_101]|nr:hypothetical protein [Cyanobacteria bacterium RI_101]